MNLKKIKENAEKTLASLDVIFNMTRGDTIKRDAEKAIAYQKEIIQIIELQFARPKIFNMQKLCGLDGNALFIFGKDFKDLMNSPAMFITLTEEQLEEFEAL